MEEKKETGIRIKRTRLAQSARAKHRRFMQSRLLRNIEHAHGLKYRSD